MRLPSSRCALMDKSLAVVGRKELCMVEVRDCSTLEMSCQRLNLIRSLSRMIIHVGNDGESDVPD